MPLTQSRGEVVSTTGPPNRVGPTWTWPHPSGWPRIARALASLAW